MVLREEFFPSSAVMSHEIDVVRVATKGKPRFLSHAFKTGGPDIWAVSGDEQKAGMCHLRYSDAETEGREEAVSPQRCFVMLTV